MSKFKEAFEAERSAIAKKQEDERNKRSTLINLVRHIQASAGGLNCLVQPELDSIKLSAFSSFGVNNHLLFASITYDGEVFYVESPYFDDDEIRECRDFESVDWDAGTVFARAISAIEANQQ